MINNIISLLFGILVKIVDDHYDMNLYSKNLIYCIKIILTFITLYWINIDFDYCTAMVIITIICYFIKQVDKMYYKFVAILIIMTFIYQFDIKKFTITKIYEILSLIIIASILGYAESKNYTEEISYSKFYSRLIGCIITILYLYLYNFHYYLYEMLKNNKQIGQIFTLLEPDINPILVVLGYGIMSVINLNNQLKNS